MGREQRTKRSLYARTRWSSLAEETWEKVEADVSRVKQTISLDSLILPKPGPLFVTRKKVRFSADAEAQTEAAMFDTNRVSTCSKGTISHDSLFPGGFANKLAAVNCGYHQLCDRISSLRQLVEGSTILGAGAELPKYDEAKENQNQPLKEPSPER